MRIPHIHCFSGVTLQWRHDERDDVSNQGLSRLLAQPFVRALIKENIKAPPHWPLWGQSTGDRWIPLTKGQWRGKVSILWRHPGYGLKLRIDCISELFLPELVLHKFLQNKTATDLYIYIYIYKTIERRLNIIVWFHSIIIYNVPDACHVDISLHKGKQCYRSVIKCKQYGNVVISNKYTSRIMHTVSDFFHYWRRSGTNAYSYTHSSRI